MIQILFISVGLLAFNVIVQRRRLPLQNVIASMAVIGITAFLFSQVGWLLLKVFGAQSTAGIPINGATLLAAVIWITIILYSRNMARRIISRFNPKTQFGTKVCLLAVAVGTALTLVLASASPVLLVPQSSRLLMENPWLVWFWYLLENLVMQVAITPWMISKSTFD